MDTLAHGRQNTLSQTWHIMCGTCSSSGVEQVVHGLLSLFDLPLLVPVSGVGMPVFNIDLWIRLFEFAGELAGESTGVVTVLVVLAWEFGTTAFLCRTCIPP